MGKLIYGVLIVLVCLVVIAFFMPWVKLESTPLAGKFTKILVGKEAKVSESISAYQVPTMANTEDARLSITVIRILNPDIEDADKKVFLIWLVPFLAVGIIVTSLILRKNKWVHLAYAAIGIFIFAFGAYRITNLKLDRTFLDVTIGPGLWLTLWAYLGIGLCELFLGTFPKVPHSR